MNSSLTVHFCDFVELLWLAKGTDGAGSWTWPSGECLITCRKAGGQKAACVCC